MLRYVGTRALTSLVMLAAVSVLIFAILRALPGDPVITRLGASPGVDPAVIRDLRQEIGLDKPLPEQYLSWVSGMLHGDFGRSYFSQYSVTSLIAGRVGPTLMLTALTVLLTVVLAVPTAVAAALRPNSLFDRLLNMLATVGMAFPPFVLGLLLLLIFSVQLDLLPTRGYVSPGEDPLESLRRMLLPATTLSLVAAPLVMRFLRSSMLEVLGSPYVRTAVGKGLPRRQVILSHALRNALIPGLTMLGLVVGYTLSGVVIIEYVFGLPGLGTLAVESAFKRDYAVLQSVTLLAGATFIGTTLVIDLLYGALDPRLRVGRGSP